MVGSGSTKESDYLFYTRRIVILQLLRRWFFNKNQRLFYFYLTTNNISILRVLCVQLDGKNVISYKV